MISKIKTLKLATLAFATILAGGAVADTIKIAGWGAKSGPLRSFGVNSEAIHCQQIRTNKKQNTNTGTQRAKRKTTKTTHQ